ncbi:LysR family transcriptional regulator [Nocardia sp. NPDC088792]|uniref:LysR family transcriptional regulator n=1 Tax=Nocardia sp. NPDC088792 TaxID=3364332 RepID=UPI003818F62C
MTISELRVTGGPLVRPANGAWQSLLVLSILSAITGVILQVRSAAKQVEAALQYPDRGRKKGHAMESSQLPPTQEPLNLYRLAQFLEVAEQLSFTRAARKLHITQQALSTSVRRLEKELGVTLFERTTRRVALTRAGRTLRDGSRTLLMVSREVRVQTRQAGAPQPLI